MRSEITVGELAGRFLERYVDGEWEAELSLAEIRARWSEIAGPLSVNSYPDKLQKGTLSLVTEHTAYIQELQLLQNEFKKRIKAMLGIHIQQIRVRKGRIDRKKPREDSDPTPLLNDAEIQTLQDILEQI